MKLERLNPNSQKAKLIPTKTFLVTLLLIFVAQFTSAQAVITVDSRSESGAMYRSLQTAIDDAMPGDIIHIHPSPTSYGSVTLKKTLTLIGLGHNPANEDGLRASITNLTINCDCPNSVVKGLNIGGINGNSGVNHDGIQLINNRIASLIQGSNTVGRADNWIIEGNYIAYTGPMYAYASNNWRISNNWTLGYFSSMNNTTIINNNVIIKSGSGTPLVFASCNSPIVANNIFLFTGTGTGVGLSSSTVNFQNCMSYSYTGTTLTPLGDGTGGNIDNAPNLLFTNVPSSSVTDFYNNDYSLAAGSDGVGAGTDTTDLGVYGRNFNFDPDGRPDLVPYPTLINITNSVIAPGQTLNVIFKASIKQ